MLACTPLPLDDRALYRVKVRPEAMAKMEKDNAKYSHMQLKQNPVEKIT
jgi:hypothetical protein